MLTQKASPSNDEADAKLGCPMQGEAKKDDQISNETPPTFL